MNHPTCATCGRTVTNYEVKVRPEEDDVIIVARCHGQEETKTFTRLEAHFLRLTFFSPKETTGPEPEPKARTGSTRSEP